MNTVNADPAELQKFSDLAHRWWDPASEFRPLHEINPLRLGWIDGKAALAGKKVLDIGCGGGILAEPLARLGGRVTAIDAAAEAIAVAKAHAAEAGLEIDYRQSPVETLVEEGRRFDLVTCMEVVEHVADVPVFLRGIARLLKPGGLLVFSTPNRTALSYGTLIVGAEWVLRFIPRGTHDWNRFLTPEELTAALASAGLRVTETRGIGFRPSRGFELSDDRRINYIGAAVHA